jgi:hypothetical protein
MLSLCFERNLKNGKGNINCNYTFSVYSISLAPLVGQPFTLTYFSARRQPLPHFYIPYRFLSLYQQTLYMKYFAYLCLILCTFESTAQLPIYPYSDGHLWGLTNANREVIAPPQFDTSAFFDGTYAIAIKSKKYGTIGRDGKTQIGFTYDKIIEVQEGFGRGLINGKNILLNLTTGKAVSPDPIDAVEANCYCEDKLFIIVKNSRKFIISGITGKLLGKTGYEQAEFFSRDFGPRALVKTGGKFGLIDTKTGAYVIPAKYDIIKRSYHNDKDVIEVAANGKTAYLDGNGKPIKEEPRPANADEETIIMEVAPPAGEDEAGGRKDLYVYNLGNNNWKLSLESRSYGNTKVFQTFDLNGYTAVEKIAYRNWDSKIPAIIKAVKDGKTGFIGLKGEVLVPFEYDNIEPIKDIAYYRTIQGNKVGVLKNNLVELKKPVLKQVLVEEYRVNALLVEMPGGQRGFMDKETGKIYIPGIEE